MAAVSELLFQIPSNVLSCGGFCRKDPSTILRLLTANICLVHTANPSALTGEGEVTYCCPASRTRVEIGTCTTFTFSLPPVVINSYAMASEIVN